MSTEQKAEDVVESLWKFLADSFSFSFFFFFFSV